ncbi:DUF4345 domain-containing protein [Parasphingorhabdus halotolerans]|uniref:DUF4345 domain-containing protein n=1 Tax=Parasphingorhabdus halotolerans TaxID=2725558 RepID=A0A6H2DNJ3_9SPHN|nr:DUF4345 domain-containing protein [Parasphingorhabdus halotolerans]QJB69924.1 DUF4345 domain-containing protein [Parasphingorhabdus halotolerans]
MRTALIYFSRLFGFVCVIVALSHIVLGPDVIPGGVPVNATMDSEDRFYASLFLGFGLAIIWCSFDLENRSGVYLALMAVFFFGGIARIISVVQVGWPFPLFIFLGALELIIPPICWYWLRSLRQQTPD